MIELKNVRKNFDNLEVLSDINITINDGEIYGIVGQSGAGKSTLLALLEAQWLKYPNNQVIIFDKVKLS